MILYFSSFFCLRFSISVYSQVYHSIFQFIVMFVIQYFSLFSGLSFYISVHSDVYDSVFQFILVFTFADFTRSTYGDYHYPVYADVLGWLITVVEIMCIPGVAIFILLTTDTDLPLLEVCIFILFIWVLTSLSTHYTGHITTGSWKGRGNQYIQLVKVLYCKLPANGKQLPAFPLEVGPVTEPRSQRWRGES